MLDTAIPLNSTVYRGRFAPSPTGPLHLGSVVAALASFLDARANGGRWLVRMEDIDPPRAMPGAASEILRTLERLQLHWDEDVLYQSTRTTAYQDALATLRAKGLLYACRCSRLELTGSPIYPGTCRPLNLSDGPGMAVRCKLPTVETRFNDRLQGNICQQLAHAVGDFVLRRKDGFFAYQLAVVVDDAWQGITDVVRGYDLLDSTTRQMQLQRWLQLPEPRYAHIPLLINRLGQKLGKQQHAPAVDAGAATTVLWRALVLLKQTPDPGLQQESAQTLLRWAIAHWCPELLTGIAEIPEP